MATQTKVAAKNWGIFVDGKWLNEGESSEIRSPYDHSVIAEVRLGTTFHTEAAVLAAQRAFETTKKSPSYERKRILNSISEGIRARHEEFSQVMCLEAGKPIKTARVEVDRAIFTFAVAAEEATRIGGEWLPLDWQSSTAGRAGIVRRFPLGPILAITPFNFPLNLVAHKVAPAIAAGCTIVLKPAPQTPLCSLLLAEVVAGAGLTAGAFNVLPLANDVAEKLVSDDRLKMLIFTGSAKVGWALKQKAGKKKVTLELGGNAGVIVHSDADVTYAAERCVAGGFGYSGQTCISVQRIYVQQAAYENFLSALVAGVKKLRMGETADGLHAVRARCY